MKEAYHTGGTIPIQYESDHFVSGFGIIYTPSFLSDDYKGWLHAEECEYYNKLKFDKRKFDFLRGRIAAKNAITRLFEIKDPVSFSINAGVFKFPVVKGIPNVRVSITHVEKFAVALAFPEEHPMGIDMEKADNTELDAMQSQCCENEAGLIRAIGLPPGIGYTMLWTIKESLSKILKTGLTINFKLLQIEMLAKENGHYAGTFSNFHQYKTVSYIKGEYVCSIVLPVYSKVDLNPFWNSLESAIKL